MHLLAALLHTFRFIMSHPLNRRHRFRALARYVAWQIYKRVIRRAVVVQIPTGGRIKVHADNKMAAAVLYVGLPEYDEMLFVNRLLRHGDVFIDIGANIGTYSVIALSTAGVRVVAFEPSASTFARLAENVALNGAATRAHLVRSAVGDRVGEVAFTISEDSTAHITGPGETSNKTVPLTTLDVALADVGLVTIVKMDVEGAEAHVLRGAQRFMAASRPLVWIVELLEVGRRYGLHDQDVIAMLAAVGYAPFVYEADAARLVPFNPRHARGNNALFIADLAAVRERLTVKGHGSLA